METTKNRVGANHTGSRSDWIGDRVNQNTDFQSFRISGDSVSDGLSTLYGPEFSVSHVSYEGKQIGLTADFPETEHFRAVSFRSWVPEEMAVNPLLPRYSDAPHITVLDPNDLNQAYTFMCLNRDRANYLATILAAQTNPGRPEVSLPALVGESLGDLARIPDSILQKGRDQLAGRAPPGGGLDSAGAYFGVLPLVSDVLKLSRLSGAVDDRCKNLSNLQRKSGARVKKTLFKGRRRETYAPELIGDTARFWPDATIHVRTDCKVWGVTHWVPGADFTQFLDENNQISRSRVTALLTGTSAYKDKVAYLKDVWELVPWSWLADWYGNFGTYLEANGNSNIASFERTHIMCELVTRRTFSCALGSISLLTTTRERCPGHPSMQLRLPFLTPQKLSILAAISARHRPLGRRPTDGEGIGNPNVIS